VSLKTLCVPVDWFTYSSANAAKVSCCYCWLAVLATNSSSDEPLHRHTALQHFTQQASLLCSACLIHLGLRLLITKLTGSSPNSSLIFAFLFFSFSVKPHVQLVKCTHFSSS